MLHAASGRRFQIHLCWSVCLSKARKSPRQLQRHNTRNGPGSGSSTPRSAACRPLCRLASFPASRWRPCGIPSAAGALIQAQLLLQPPGPTRSPKPVPPPSLPFLRPAAFLILISHLGGFLFVARQLSRNRVGWLLKMGSGRVSGGSVRNSGCSGPSAFVLMFYACRHRDYSCGGDWSEQPRSLKPCPDERKILHAQGCGPLLALCWSPSSCLLASTALSMSSSSRRASALRLY